MRLIFMGTPEFAVPALEALLARKHEIVAVYTQPPRPAGRGQQLRKSPVHELAERHEMPVHTPEKLKDPALHHEFAVYKADAAIVAAYGLLLTVPILEATKYGCINIHPSLLPRWRGAAPIQRSVMAGDTETGVCIMRAEAGLDTGPVFTTEKMPMPPRVTSGELHDLLAAKGAEMLVRLLDDIDAYPLKPQTEEGATYAKKVTKADCPLDWNKNAAELDAQIRGLNPYPLATTQYHDTVLKIHAAEVVDAKGEPGTVLDDNLTVACGSGALRISCLQKPGGKAIATADFLRGFPIPKFERLK